MNRSISSVTYACPDSVRWVKDTDQVILLDEQTGRSHILQGMEAAIWGWLSLAYSYRRITPLVAALLAQPPAEAEQTLLATLERWQVVGWLEVRER